MSTERRLDAVAGGDSYNYFSPDVCDQEQQIVRLLPALEFHSLFSNRRMVVDLFPVRAFTANFRMADNSEVRYRPYLIACEPLSRISTSLLALCCQSGLDATLATPMRARSRSIGSRSLRISPLLTARFTSLRIASCI